MNMEEAVKATRRGALVGGILAVLMSFTTGLAIADGREQGMGHWSLFWLLSDMVIIAGCSVGIYRKSRVASVILLVYYVCMRVNGVMAVGFSVAAFRGLPITFLFVYVLGKAVEGCFAYHQLRKEEDPDYIAGTPWDYLFGIPVVLIAGRVLLYWFLASTGAIVPTHVQSGKEVSVDTLIALRNANIILNGETVAYYCAHGTYSVLGGGNVLTDQHVVFYYEDESGVLQVKRLALGEVTHVRELSPGDGNTEALVLVGGASTESWVELHLSSEGNGRRKFLDALYRKIPDGAVITIGQEE